jgi:MtrB/PioB family decaheme-associated outer membrane protein
MHGRFTTPLAALLLILPVLAAAPPAAQAQQATQAQAPGVLGLPPPQGRIDVGARVTGISGDQARFQRFRDFGDGAFLETFRWNRERDAWVLSFGADHVGRQDQRYFGEVERPGRLKASFLWDQIPLLISRDTRTLYSTEAPGVLRIDDRIQQGIQAGAFTIRDVVGDAVGFDTKNRRDLAAVSVLATPSRDVDVKMRVSTAKREGNMPWGASFAFNHAIEVAAPLDTRTTDVQVGVEWANQRGMLRAGYDGSWFDNAIPVLVWDNPIRLTDTISATATTLGDASSQGRMALWPSNSLHTVSAAGAYRLPGRSRLFGHVAVGTSRQNEAIVPFTINTALPVIPLERPTAEAEIRTVATTLQFTSRPTRLLSIVTRYRYHDLDNRTPHFTVTQTARLDQAVQAFALGGPEFYSIQRQTFDADATIAPRGFVSFKAGYGRGHSDRAFRHFEVTTEDTFRASVDLTGNQYVTVRTLAEHSVRKGDLFDVHVLEAVGEQPGMRHFDIADRDRNRVTALVTVTPAAALAVTGSVAAGRDEYRESQFGLRDNDHRVYTIGIEASPREALGLGLSYGFENYTAFQRSRNATPGVQFTDPSRDWSTDSDDTVHTFDAWVDLMRLFPRSEVKLGYGYSRARSVYVYGLAPGSPLAAPQQLPPVQNILRNGTVDTRIFLNRQLALGVVYLYEHYTVDDFALGGGTISGIALPQVEPGTPLVPTTGILLDYMYRPYRAHSGWLRLTYYW